MQNITREGRHEHRIRPPENSNDGEKGKDGEDTPVIPNVTKSLQRLADRARFALARCVFRQPHQEKSGDDGEKGEAVEQETRGNAGLGYEKTGDRRADEAGAVEGG